MKRIGILNAGGYASIKRDDPRALFRLQMNRELKSWAY